MQEMKKIISLLLFAFCTLSAFADSYLYLDNVTIKPGETKTISVSLKNDVKITAFQCDLYFPAGITVTQTYSDKKEKYVNDIALTDRKQDTHTLNSNTQKDGAMRIAVLSTANDPFTGSDGPLFTIQIKADEQMSKGDYSIKLANVELSTPAAVAINPSDRTSLLSVVNEYTITTGTSIGGTVTGNGTYTSNQDVTLTATPETGYHFVSWSNGNTANPLVFTPTKSETINATFAPNKYGVNYVINGNKEHVDSVEYKAAITAWTAPTQEGYTFSGWSTIPATMPAQDITITGSYTVNSYSLIYMVDGVEYKKVSVAYGSAITPEAAPTKEGYTFSGWSTIPTTMPAKDVTITGTFNVDTYKVTFVIDGTTLSTIDVAYGGKITAPDAPTKEGYTFSGWSTIPTTMPAKDVTITGSYAVNSYSLIYMVDGVEYKKVSVAYGSAITPEAAPTKEGYTFSGWSTIPTTMPAKDVTINGTFNVNYYTIAYKVDGIVYKTVSVAYGSTLIPEPAPIKEGYIFSGWSSMPVTMPANDIEVTGSFTINGIKEISSDFFVNVYNIEGKMIKSHISIDKLKETLPTGLYIVNRKKCCIIHN
jgi:uncharacterized repeat protein (TIGR02543 family)